VNILRVQRERLEANLLPSLREYAIRFGVTRERLRYARPDVLIMHPGPMNRGIEIAQDVAEDERAVILEQVTNGVAVRMAVLYHLSGSDAFEVRERTEESPSLGSLAETSPSLRFKGWSL
jgi:aspartate carbamoyltransferase catalytic subunit